jgi:hypothetical protein
MLSGIVAQTVGLLSLSWSVYDTWRRGVQISVVIYLVSFALGMGGTMPLYCAEIIPAVGVSVGVALQWITSGIIAYTIPQTIERIGVQGFIYFFIGCNVISFFIIYFLC